MPKTLTPLRYPGGKTKITPFIVEILRHNNLIGGTYAEPFAGGAGIAIRLLLDGLVSQIVLNDFDYSIYSFWDSVVTESEALCKLIIDTPITVDEWKKQKWVYLNPDNESKLSVGFATLFLNRANVSGILTGGIIGGITQKGKYKIDSRFNKEMIINKIQNIALHKKSIVVSCEDATSLISSDYYSSFSNCLIYIDPPYVKKGQSLYKNSFTLNDHIKLSEAILNNMSHWVLTYDIHSLISDLYSTVRSDRLKLNYSISKPASAEELVFFSNHLRIKDYDF